MNLNPDAAVRHWMNVNDSVVICRSNALALGMTDRMIKYRVDTGVWRRIKSGCYVVLEGPEEWLTVLAAATQSLSATVSHESAAYLHGMHGIPRGLRVVTVPVRTTKVFPGVDIHQSTDLIPDFITKVDGLPVTTATRTVIDLARGFGLARLRRTVERCVVQGLFTIENLSNDFARLGRRGRPGTVKMRVVLAELMPHLEAIESELERIFLELLREFGLPIPEVQVVLSWRKSRSGRVDFVYRQVKLIIECDGRKWHRDTTSFEEDRRRDNEAMLAGWRVLRVTWDMITNNPRMVAKMVADALEG